MKILLTLAAAALATSPGFAQDASGPVVVSYADLDLRTEAGVRMLDRRIRSAIQQACGSTSDFDPAGTNAVRDCRTDTRERLSAQRETAIAAAARSTPVELASQR